jgi:hypothetical protein
MRRETFSKLQGCSEYISALIVRDCIVDCFHAAEEEAELSDQTSIVLSKSQ